MNKILTGFLLGLTVLITQSASAQNTLLQRVDVAKGTTPYCTTAVLLESGWEVWGFGWTQSPTRDLEVGRLFPMNKKLLFGGYGVVWPDSGRTFLLPWAAYSDRLLGASLSLNLASYIPLNGGPHILFSDGSSLMWRNARGDGIGLSGTMWNQEGTRLTFRIGPQAEFVHKNTTVKLNYQPLYLSGSSQGVVRIEVSQKL